MLGFIGSEIFDARITCIRRQNDAFTWGSRKGFAQDGSEVHTWSFDSIHRPHRFSTFINLIKDCFRMLDPALSDPNLSLTLGLYASRA